MFFYDFRCQRCGWDMERLVSRHVIEIKCPMCGNMSQKQMKALKADIADPVIKSWLPPENLTSQNVQ